MDPVAYSWIAVAALAAFVAAVEPRRRVLFAGIAGIAVVLAGAVYGLGGRAGLRDGLRLVYTLDPEGVKRDEGCTQAIVRARAVVEQRLDAMWLRGAKVRAEGCAITIEVAGDAERLEIVKRTVPAWGRIELEMVDDDQDFFQPYADAADLPTGLRIEPENAPLGPGKTAPRYFAFLPRAEGESMRDALERLKKWVATLKVPADREIAFEKVIRYDEATEVWEDEGWRTFYLHANAEITGAMIKEAQARPDQNDPARGGWLVALEFTPEGGARFEALTERNVKRRFAILMDGVVESAPVIQTKIAGGRGVITMGQGTPEEQRRNAQQLEAVLRSGELPSALDKVSEEPVPGVLGRPATAAFIGLAFAAILGLLGFMLVGTVRGAPRPQAAAPRATGPSADPK
jgi:preprotein translocase subunit SecD